MPLGFNSLNHGEIAFGFFNIETDLLLLDRYFFYADEFCRQVVGLSRKVDGAPVVMPWSVYYIGRRQDIGDLMGAIHGVNFSGFIGDVYQRFPFPRDMAGFKQKPRGGETRPIVQPLLEKYAVKADFPLELCLDLTVHLGPYAFSTAVFQQLVNYVWLGGYPRWLDGIRPDYVREMKDCLTGSAHQLFKHLDFEDRILDR